MSISLSWYYTKMISFKNISVSFGSTQALKNISLSIHKNQAVALLGLSGCGKSTLMKSLVGLVSPSSGSIYWDGVQLNNQSFLEIRKKIGYMPQDGGLFPNLSNIDNVLIGGVQGEISDRQKKQKVFDLAELTQLPQEVLFRKPLEVSGGQRQRVSLMRALFNDPEVLLLDEPFSALDPIVRSELQIYMKNLIIKLKKSLVIVTHDIFEASYLADNIFLMNAGEIVQSGTLKDFIDSPKNEFVSQFASIYQLQYERVVK